MLTTKRYEYMPFDNIRTHPVISNHRPLEARKVAHLEKDILENGLLEPLIVWEPLSGDYYYLVGGFHRMAAVKAIREKHPGYFDQIDVRVVSGGLDEMKALNLKLNADRLGAKITDYFDTVLYLNNANWNKQRIASFLDKSLPWLEDIMRFVPGMDPRLRKLLEEEKVSWNKAKSICRRIRSVPADYEKELADQLIETAGNNGGRQRRKSLLSPRKAVRRLTEQIGKGPKRRYTIESEDLLSLFILLAGRDYTQSHVDRVRKVFPDLME
jgi:hypothetical protein